MLNDHADKENHPRRKVLKKIVQFVQLSVAVSAPRGPAAHIYRHFRWDFLEEHITATRDNRQKCVRYHFGEVINYRGV